MIKSFRCKKTKILWDTSGRGVPAFASFASVAMRKLRMIDAAGRLDDLKQPPGNRLEPLYGDRVGQHSIRINDKYRICFIWSYTGVDNVEIVDYH